MTCCFPGQTFHAEGLVQSTVLSTRLHDQRLSSSTVNDIGNVLSCFQSAHAYTQQLPSPSFPVYPAMPTSAELWLGLGYSTRG